MKKIGIVVFILLGMNVLWAIDPVQDDINSSPNVDENYDPGNPSGGNPTSPPAPANAPPNFDQDTPSNPVPTAPQPSPELDKAPKKKDS